uniref:Plasmid stabilization protein n=1 Tax=Steinernema glaseri TaxID=37863 RepID=A0A1I7YMD1_9BILA
NAQALIGEDVGDALDDDVRNGIHFVPFRT